MQEGERLIGYARVSTEDQRLDLQLDALRGVGCLPDDIHTDKVSAASRRRPGLDLAIKALRPGDTLVVWRLDRLARSMRELYRRLDQVAEAGAAFKSLSESFDFSTTSGRFILGVLGLVAEFERQLIADRTAAGIQAWRERGGSPGAPSKVTPRIEERARRMLKDKSNSLATIAAACGVSVGTLKNHGLTRKRRHK